MRNLRTVQLHILRKREKCWNTEKCPVRTIVVATLSPQASPGSYLGLTVHVGDVESVCTTDEVGPEPLTGLVVSGTPVVVLAGDTPYSAPYTPGFGVVTGRPTTFGAYLRKGPVKLCQGIHRSKENPLPF